MTAKSDNMNLLQAAIEREHNCVAVLLRTVPVTQALAGKLIWANDVEVFRLQSHSEVKNCFAWLDLEQNGELRYVIVLETLHLNSPEAAVRFAIFYDAQPIHYPRANSTPPPEDSIHASDNPILPGSAEVNPK